MAGRTSTRNSIPSQRNEPRFSRGSRRHLDKFKVRTYRRRLQGYEQERRSDDRGLLGSWIEGTVTDLAACLRNDEVPPASENCECCPYREAAGKELQAFAKIKKTLGSGKSSGDGTLGI